MIRHVIGVDPKTTRIAYTVMTGYRSRVPKVVLDEIPPRASFESRCHAAKESARALTASLAGDGYPIHVFCELPLVGRSVVSSLKVAKVTGALIAGLLDGEPSTKVYEVNTSRWKKQIVGSGNATKAMVVTWLEESWPDAYEAMVERTGGVDFDIADSAALCRYGMRAVYGVGTVFRIHRPRGRRKVVL
jgi:Holliday junction resolvasome RuvABC endonuclease subunit